MKLMTKHVHNAGYLTIVAIVLFHIVINFFWLREDNFPHGYEVIDLLIMQTHAHNILKGIPESVRANGFPEFKLMDIVRRLNYFFNDFGQLNRPNLVHFVASTGNALFGRSTLITTLFTNSLYLLILCFSVFNIGRFIRNSETGILATLFVTLYPGIFGFSRKYGLDFPLTALVSLCIYALLRAKCFSMRNYSILFGILIGIGVLTKAQIGIFLFPPLAYCLLRLIWLRQKDCLINMFLSLLTATIISSVWLKGKFLSLFEDFVWHASAIYNPASMVHAPAYSLSSISFYLIETCKYVSPLFLIALLVALPYFAKGEIKQKIMLGCWLIGPLIILTLIAVKWGRFYFPCFPAIALITASGIMAMEGKAARKILIFLLTALGIVQFILLSYHAQWVPRHWVEKMTLLDSGDDLAHPPLKTNHEAIAKDMIGVFRKLNFTSRDAVQLGMIEIRGSEEDFTQDDSSYLEYFLIQGQPLLNMYRSSAGRGLHEAQAFFNNIHNMDFLIVVNDSEAERPSLQFLDRCQAWGTEHTCFTDEKTFLEILAIVQEFTLIKTFSLSYAPFKLFMLVNPRYPVPIS